MKKILALWFVALSIVLSQADVSLAVITHKHAATYINASSSFGGVYAEWRQQWYPEPGSSPHHHNHTLWLWTDGTKGESEYSNAFMEIGYWHGWNYNGDDVNAFYWARQTTTTFYETNYTTAVLPGANGTNHSFTIQLEYVNGYEGYRGYIDGVQICQKQQGWPSVKAQCGLESTLDATSENAKIPHTYPSYLQYKTNNNWVYWTYGAVKEDLPYNWSYRDGVYYKGDDWNDYWY